MTEENTLPDELRRFGILPFKLSDGSREVKLKGLARLLRALSKELRWSSSHPDSGAPIEGIVVPGLSACLEGITEAARHFPFCPLIGWDVTLTNDGFRVLEANPEPAFTVWQIHQPLLGDERNRAFFRYWGLGSESTD